MPESSGLLKEIDSAVKAKSKLDSKEERKRRILQRCGCI